MRCAIEMDGGPTTVTGRTLASRAVCRARGVVFRCSTGVTASVCCSCRAVEPGCTLLHVWAAVCVCISGVASHR